MADDLNPTQGSQETPAPSNSAETPAAAEAPVTPVAAEAPVRGQRGGRGGGGGGGGGGQRKGRRDSFEQRDDGGLGEVVVKVYRCATVVKGGRRFSFAALVVVGDRQSRVGIGYGKANEVPNAVEKARKQAQRSMITVPLHETSIPHQVKAKYESSRVVMLPAGKGTGVIAGASVRAVLELAGIKDVLTKVYGSTSPKNLVRAAFNGLASLRPKEYVARLREVSLS